MVTSAGAGAAELLRRHEGSDLLRFLTCGSVDDGKSTLIGRLLHDSKTLYEDTLASLEKDSKRVGNAGGAIDFSLLLDGLKAEREWFTRIFEQYLEADDRRSALVQLIDARHEPTVLDIESVERMMRTGRPVCIVFTKSDKVNKSSQKARITKALRQFNARPETGVVSFSSITGAGKAELWAWIEARLSL